MQYVQSLEEVKKALIEDLEFSTEEAEQKVNDLRKISRIVRPKEKIDIIKDDPSDNKILECARRGKASFIVTGDHHLLDLGIYKGIKIVTVTDFIKILREEGII